MLQAANCKKCGELFVQASNIDLCDECFQKQVQMVADINDYVLSMEEETITVEEILEKFDLKRSEFDELCSAGKFVAIANKVTMVCTSCKQVTTIKNKTGGLCAACVKKLKNEL